jgi:hypothetical protein
LALNIGLMLVQMLIATTASMLVARLVKKPKQDVPEFGNYPSQTSMKGMSIPKVYGTRRVAGNIIYYKSTDYYRSNEGVSWYFHNVLLSLCEGPATVRRIWYDDGTECAGGPHLYFFDGDGTTGWRLRDGKREETGKTIRELTGEEFGDYPNLCCAFLEDVTAGELRKDVPNFTFEVTSTGKLDYFVGCYFSTGTDKSIVYKLDFDGEIVTSWADNGGWHYASAYGSTWACYDLVQLSDGRVLVVHNKFWIEGPDISSGKCIGCTMLTSNGAIDTSWGYNGHYVLAQSGDDRRMVTPYKILCDNSGNFHLFGWSDFGHTHNYHIFNSQGTRLYSYGWSARHFQSFYDATFNAGKSRIIAVGTNISIGGTQTNTIAFDPSDGTIDDDWDGNLGLDGYGHYGIGSGRDAYAIGRVSDGYIIHFQHTGTDDRTLAKISLDGSAVDASWGTAGYNEGGRADFYKKGLAVAGDAIYTLGQRLDGGVVDQTIQDLKWWDANGNLVDSVSWDGATFGIYHCLGLVISQLIIGTKKLDPAINDIENWSFDLDYIRGFDIPANPTTIEAIHPMRHLSDILDVNPVDIIRDLATNTRYGAGLSVEYIDEPSFAAVHAYCQDNNLLISLVLKDSKPLTDWIDHVLAHCNGYRWWSGGKLKLGVFKDEDAVGEPITADDLVVDEGPNPAPPLQITTRERSETFNRVELTWTNRENIYDLSQVIAQDQVDQRVSGQVRTRVLNLDGICRPEMAQTMVYRSLYESMNRFNIFSFRLGYKHMLLEIGDVKLLTDGHLVQNQKVRILSIEEQHNGRQLAIEAVEEKPELYGAISIEAQAAWTPQMQISADSVTCIDAAAVGVTPIYPNIAENISLNDYAHLEVV